MTNLRRLIIVIIVLLMATGCSVSSTVVDCNKLIGSSSLLGSRFNEINVWHNSGYCGQDIVIGLIVQGSINSSTDMHTLIDQGILFDYTSSSLDRQDIEVSDRIQHYIELIHLIAPKAKIKVVTFDPTLSSLSPIQSIKDATEEYIQRTQLIQDADIIVNLVIYQGFEVIKDTDTVYDQLIRAINAHLENPDKYWVTAVEMFGNSHYRSVFADDKIRPNLHRFDKSGASYLHIGIVNPNKPVDIVWTQTASDVEFDLRFSIDDQPRNSTSINSDRKALNILDSLTIAPSEFNGQKELYLFLGKIDPTSVEQVEFELFFRNAVILNDVFVNIGIDSIPAPSQYHRRMITVGSCPIATSFGKPIIASNRQSTVDPAPTVIERGTYLPSDNCEGDAQYIDEYYSGYATALTAGTLAIYLNYQKDTEQSPCGRSLPSCLTESSKTIENMPILSLIPVPGSFGGLPPQMVQIIGIIIAVLLIITILFVFLRTSRIQISNNTPLHQIATYLIGISAIFLSLIGSGIISIEAFKASQGIFLVVGLFFGITFVSMRQGMTLIEAIINSVDVLVGKLFKSDLPKQDTKEDVDKNKD